MNLTKKDKEIVLAGVSRMAWSGEISLEKLYSIARKLNNYTDWTEEELLNMKPEVSE